MKLQDKKRIYVTLIETLVLNGYDIAGLLNPNYSKIDFDKVRAKIDELNNSHQENPFDL